MITDRFQFRVFLIDYKYYINTNLYDFAFNENMYFSDCETIIQQCIGVRDKTNRLIYEGDIVIWKVVNTITPAIGEVIYTLDCFSIYTIQDGTYYNFSEQEIEELRKDRFEEDLEENNYYYFYDDHLLKEFTYNQLEVIGSIADKYLLNKDGKVIKELEETDKTKLLKLLK